MDTETEAAIRREIARQLAGMKPGEPGSYSADEYDFKAEPLTIHPGNGWLFTECVPVGIHIVVVWRKLRVQQVAEKEAPRMALATR